MTVEKLKVRGFRNLEDMTYEPDAGINIIYGENAQGKTNLLESIWLYSGLKSFRHAKDRELIGFGREFARTEMVFDSSFRKNTASITVKEKRTAVLNGVELKSCSSLIGKFSAVVFSPSFLSIVQSGPDERRKFLDCAVCQLNPSYASLLTEYSKIIKQRNSILKDVSYNSALLDFLDTLDEKAAVTGEKITEIRKSYLEELRPVVTGIYSGLSSGREEISFDYIKKYDGGEAPLAEILKNSRKEDIINRTTSAGPHRDDIDIKINGIQAKAYGSQGQQRSCALSLKLGEAALLKEKTGETPVALLDDVMSELDTLRQDYILNHINDRQVFITCCEPSSVLRMCSGKTVSIAGGKIV